MDDGSFGLPEKPMATVPPSSACSRSRIASAAGMPSHGVMACSMPGSFLMKRPPLAMMSPSLVMSPSVVASVRPSALSPVASAARCVTPMRRKKALRSMRRSSPVRSPDGTQMSPG